MNRRGGLGRGIEAIIPTAAVAGPGVSGDTAGAGGAIVFRQIRVETISPNPRQPRSVFDEDALEQLQESIRLVGVLQPVVVREVDPGRYELVVGERRWRACRALGLERIPAVIRLTPDESLLRDALLENIHRQQLNPLEEAAAYREMLEEFGVTHEELAARVGRSRSHISNTVRLMNLPATVQMRIAAGVLSSGHARALLSLDGHEAQERLAERIVDEGLSVRAVEEIVMVQERAAQPGDPRPRRSPPAPTGLEDVAARLADHFETRVRVDMGRRKGKITIEFGSVEDLERIIASMVPVFEEFDLPGFPQTPAEAAGREPASVGGVSVPTE